MSSLSLGKYHTNYTKIKLSANYQAFALKVENDNTGKVILFTSVIKTAKFLGIHHSYLTKVLNKKKFFCI